MGLFLFINKIVYTVLTGEGYDSLKEPIKPNPSWSYVAYTDHYLQSNVWDIERIPAEDPRRISRKYKILPPPGDLVVYCDASFQVHGNLDIFALNKTFGIYLNRHPMRRCLYKEAELVIDRGLDCKESIVNQVERYRREGYPENNGLYRCGIMVRNPSQTQELCSTWWSEVENGSWRDQISFPYACWKTGMKPQIIMRGITEKYFKQHLHSPREPGEFQVHDNPKYIEPISTGDWIMLGYIPEAEKLIKSTAAHVFTSKGSLLFPRWLYNYVQPGPRFLKLIKLLHGIVIEC